jgi:Mrp family chromosome partitioning ATPase
MGLMLDALKQIEAKPLSFAFPSLPPDPHGPPPLSAQASQQSEQIVSVVNPAYEELAAHLLAQLPADRPAAVMFTSPGDGDGKTRLLRALAPVLAARADRRVLLLDADLRKTPMASLTSQIDDLKRGTLALLDAPSLLYPEVSALGGHCDGIYLVVRLGHTIRRAVGEAARAIDKSGGRLLGCAAIG